MVSDSANEGVERAEYGNAFRLRAALSGRDTGPDERRQPGANLQKSNRARRTGLSGPVCRWTSDSCGHDVADFEAVSKCFKERKADPLFVPGVAELWIISFIDQPHVIKKILQHSGLWEECHTLLQQKSRTGCFFLRLWELATCISQINPLKQFSRESQLERTLKFDAEHSCQLFNPLA
jgi:hypothetical protein